VNGEEDEGGRLCSPMWDLAEREKYFIVLYGTVGNKSRYYGAGQGSIFRVYGVCYLRCIA
jgi:hypothetical protein